MNIVDNVGETALTRALSFGHKNCVRLLIDAGADVNHENYVGDTALITTAWSGNPELVRMLLETGAHVHKTNNRGQNALTCHVAQCEIFSEELASMLVAAGEVLYFSQEEEKNGKRVARYGSRGVIAHIKVPDILLSNRLCHFKQVPDSPSVSLANGEKDDGDGNNDGDSQSESSFASDTDGDEDPVISSSDAVVGNVQEESNAITAGDDADSRTVDENTITVVAESDEEDGDRQNAEVAGAPTGSTAVTALNEDDDDIKTRSVDVDIVPTADTSTYTGEINMNATTSGIENESSRPDAGVPAPFCTDSNKVTNVCDAAAEYCVNTTWSDMPGTNLSRTSVTNHTASDVGESGVSPAVERSKAKSNDTSAYNADDDPAMDATSANIKDANTPKVKTSDSANTQGDNKERSLGRAGSIELYDDNSLKDNGGNVNKTRNFDEVEDVNKEGDLSEEGDNVNNGSDLSEEGGDVNNGSDLSEGGGDVNNGSDLSEEGGNVNNGSDLSEEGGDVNNGSDLSEEGGDVNNGSDLSEGGGDVNNGSDLSEEGGDVNNGSDVCEVDDANTSCAKSSGKRSHSEAFSNGDEYDDDSGAAHSDGDASNISNTSDASIEADSGTGGVEGGDSKENSSKKRFRCALM